MDENQHKKNGWDNERFREIFILEQALRQVDANTGCVTLIRFNPHEYSNKTIEWQEKNAHRGFVDSFTTLPHRDERLANLRNIIMWGLNIGWDSFADGCYTTRGVTGRRTSTAQEKAMILPEQNNSGKWVMSERANKINIVFAYYDRWYEDGLSGICNIHVHQYDNIEAYRTDVVRGQGLRKRLQDRQMFLQPKWWDPFKKPVILEEEKMASIFGPVSMVVSELQNQR